MPAIIPAIIGGVGLIGSAAIGSAAAGHASDVAAQAAAQNNALQAQIYGENKALSLPYIDRGNAAGDELNGFLGLGGDPAKIKAAFDTYLNSTGYQFDKQQGIDAITSNKAVLGLLNSGSALKALDEFGTGEAQRYGDAYASKLFGVAGLGDNAVNALSGAGTHYADSVSANNNSAASVSANAGLATAGQLTGLLGNAFNAYGAYRGGSSFGNGGSGYNPFAPGG